MSRRAILIKKIAETQRTRDVLIDSLRKQYDEDIARTQEELSREDEKSIWIIVRVGRWSTTVDMANEYDKERAFRGAYLTQEAALAECPVDSADHKYMIERIVLDRTRTENKIEDSPPSR